MRFDRQPNLWRDRHGRAHREIEANVPIHSASIERVTGPIEAAYARQSHDFERLLAEGLSRPNPIVTPYGRDALYTWLVEAPSAGSVLLWLADLIEPERIENAEFSRLGGTGIWALTVKLPRSWRASYRIATSAADPSDSPWRAARGYGPVRVSALESSSLDRRSSEAMRSTAGEFSLAAGPEAPPELWRCDVGHEAECSGAGRRTGGEAARQGECTRPGDSRPPRSRGAQKGGELALRGGVEQISDGCERAWIYVPKADVPDLDRPTPLLLLFDGGTWARDIELPRLLDAAIASGAIAPLHVAMLEAGSEGDRWESLGVPCGQVDAVLDWLLPELRTRYNVAHDGESTWAAGQSLGGLSALWTAALSEGQVRHVVAQSPSLWRFDLAGPLAEAPWDSIRIDVGALEGTAHLAHRLAARVPGIDVKEFCGGHDWACWRAALFSALAGM